MHEAPSWVADYIGVPWVAHGRTRQGCDCWGLVALVYRERFGVRLPLYEGWSWDPAVPGLSVEAARLRERIGALMSAESATWREIEDERARQLGDVLLIRQMGWPCHVGLFVPPSHVLHSEATLDAALERLDGMRFRRLNKVIGCFRHERLC